MEGFQIKEELNKDGTIECYTIKINMGGYYEKRRFENKEKMTAYLQKLMEDAAFNASFAEQVGSLRGKS